MKSKTIGRRVLPLVIAGHACLYDGRGRVVSGVIRQLGLSPNNPGQRAQVEKTLHDLQESGEVTLEYIAGGISKVTLVPKSSPVLTLVTDSSGDDLREITPAASEITQPTETESPMPVFWSARNMAMKDLAILALHRSGGVVKNKAGRAASQLCAQAGIDASRTKDFSPVVKKMADEELLLRDIKSTRTYEILLASALSPEEVVELEASEPQHLALLASHLPGGQPTETANAASVQDDLPKPKTTPYQPERISMTPEEIEKRAPEIQAKCQQALVVLRKHVDPKTGLGRFSGAGVLEAAGCTNPAEPRYYLRKLGLAKSIHRPESGSPFWGWHVNPKKNVELSAIVNLLTQGKIYDPNYMRDVSTLPSERATNRRYAAGIPPVLGDTQVSPVTIIKIPVKAAEPETVPENTVLANTAPENTAAEKPDQITETTTARVAADVSTDTRVNKLVKVVGLLEGKLAAETKAHRLTQESLDTVQSELATANQQLADRIVSNNTVADDVLNRYQDEI